MAKFKPTLRDVITRKLSPVMRKLNDIKVDLAGTQTQVMRITRTEIGNLGDYKEKYNATLLSNVIINYPYNAAEIFGTPEEDKEQMEIQALDIWEFLPITMRVKFEGAFYEDPIEIKQNDIIIDVIFENHGKKIPVIHQVKRLRGSWFGKHMASKTYELSLYRGDMEAPLQEVVNQYLDSIEDITYGC